MAKSEKTEKQILEEISEKLSKLVGLNAIQGKNKVEQIKILTALNFTNVEISNLTGIPKGTIDRTRMEIKTGKTENR